MKIPHLSVFAVCFAVGLTAASEPADAGFFDRLFTRVYPVQQPTKPGPPDHANSSSNRGQSNPVQQPTEPAPPDLANSNSKGYPNGRPWQEVENDFIDVKRRIGEVKDDTEKIIRRLRVVDEDLESLKGGQVRILQGIGRLEEGQDELGDTIDEIADAFSYTNVTPTADAASYCGTDVCFKEPVGSNGLYILELIASEAGNYAATVAVGVEGDDVFIDSDDSNGASIVTFEIEEPVVTPPA